MNFTGKILLADDEAHIRKFIGILVRRLGTPTVIEAREGQEAVDLFIRESPDLVLLDISMPGRDGLVHISELANFRVKQTEDIVKLGDEIWVKCLGVDEKGRVRLSRKAAMEELDRKERERLGLPPKEPSEEPEQGESRESREPREFREPRGPREQRDRGPHVPSVLVREYPAFG